MKTIFLKELKRLRTGLIIWSVLIGLVSGFGVMEYPVIGKYTGMLENALELIPKIGQILFGVYHVDLENPMGYYVVMYYWTGLLVFVHAAYTGASIIAKETRDKTAEFLFTKPYKRSVIINAKILAGFADILVIGLVTTVLSAAAMLPVTGDPVSYQQILTACIGMFLTQCVLMALGILCSALFKTYRASVTAMMAVLITSYALMFFVQYIDMPQLSFLSPLAFFSVAGVVADGLNFGYVLLALILTAICIRLGQWGYRRKELL